MTNPERQFNAIIPPDAGKNTPESKRPDSPEIPRPSNQSPIVETETVISFLGAEVLKGMGGPLTPSREKFSKDVITGFDLKLMRDLAVGLSLGQATMVEGGSGIGKSRTVERMCSYLNRESYYANCHDMDVDVLIGRMGVSKETDSKTGFEWKDGVIVQAIRNGGILFLDEYNFMKGETRAALHYILDAVLNGKEQITLIDNHNEIVSIHPDFRIIAAQNPPGDKHTDREKLDPAQYTRFSYLKYQEELPKEVRRARALGYLGKDNIINLAESEFLAQGGISREILSEVPGIEEITEKYLEFAEAVEKMVEQEQLAVGQSQKPHFSFQRDFDRVIRFVQSFYAGDLTEVFHQALRYYFVNKFEKQQDREKVLLLIKEVRYDDKPDSRRKGISKKQNPVSATAPNPDSSSFSFESFQQSTISFMLETFKNNWGFNSEQMAIAKENIEKIETFDDLRTYLDKLKEIGKNDWDHPELAGKVYQWTGEQVIEGDIEKVPVTVINPMKESWWNKFVKDNPDYKLVDVINETIRQNPGKTPAGLDYYTKILKLAESGDKEKAKVKALLGCKDGEYQWNYCPASSLVVGDGVAVAPSVRWRDGGFCRCGVFLRDDWVDVGRVVFLG